MQFSALSAAFSRKKKEAQRSHAEWPFYLVTVQKNEFENCIPRTSLSENSKGRSYRWTTCKGISPRMRTLQVISLSVYFSLLAELLTAVLIRSAAVWLQSSIDHFKTPNKQITEETFKKGTVTFKRLDAMWRYMCVHTITPWAT